MSEEKEKRTWTEEIEVAGNELLDRIKELVQEGNVRRLIIRNPEGEVMVEIPLTPAVGVGAVVALVAPVVAALGALAALVARLKIEIVRIEEPPEDESEGQ